MLIIKKLLMKILVRLNQLSTVSEVTLKREENNYVNVANFANLKMRRIGNLAIFNVNLAFSTSLPSNSTWVKIGTHSGITLVQDVSVNIPGQGAQAHILFSVEKNGNIRVYNASGTATGAGFYRAQIPIVLSGGGLLKPVFSRLSAIGRWWEHVSREETTDKYYTEIIPDKHVRARGAYAGNKCYFEQWSIFGEKLHRDKSRVLSAWNSGVPGLLCCWADSISECVSVLHFFSIGRFSNGTVFFCKHAHSTSKIKHICENTLGESMTLVRGCCYA